MNGFIYSVDDFKIKIIDNNHIWDLIKPKEYDDLDIIVYDKEYYDLVPMNDGLQSLCFCKICKSFALRIKTDDYFPYAYEYYTPQKILTCDEYIIKEIIE